MGTPSSSWVETSTNFGTPICNGDCTLNPAFGPYQGTWWAWFGGLDNEDGSISQTLVIPVGADTLRFYMELPVCEVGTYDWFEIQLDGLPVYYTDGNDPRCNMAGYEQRFEVVETQRKVRTAFGAGREAREKYTGGRNQDGDRIEMDVDPARR